MVANVTESELVSRDGITASTGTFELRGGYYDFAVSAADWGETSAETTITVSQLLPDGSSYRDMLDAALKANGGDQFYAPSGVYRFTVAGTAGATIGAVLSRIPLGN